MQKRWCKRHGHTQIPCAYSMGKVYRMVEPVLLLILNKKSAHGYELVELANQYALTDSFIDAAVVYRTLRELEVNGYVISKWEIKEGRPARRTYTITEAGKKLLADWIIIIENQKESLEKFLKEYKEEK